MPLPHTSSGCIPACPPQAIALVCLPSGQNFSDVVSSSCQLDVTLESPGKRDPGQVGLCLCQWSIFFIADCYKEGPAHCARCHRKVGLSCVRKVSSKLVRTNPEAAFLQAPALVTAWTSLLMGCNSNKPSHPPSCFCSECFITTESKLEQSAYSPKDLILTLCPIRQNSQPQAWQSHIGIFGQEWVCPLKAQEAVLSPRPGCPWIHSAD